MWRRRCAAIHPAACVDVIDLWLEETEYQGQRRLVNKVRLVFETEQRTEDGKNCIASKTFAANHSRALVSSKSATTSTSRRSVVKNGPAAISQSPSSQARRCHPVNPSRTRVYSGLFHRLSVTLAAMNRVSVSARRSHGSINSFRYHAERTRAQPLSFLFPRPSLHQSGAGWPPVTGPWPCRSPPGVACRKVAPSAGGTGERLKAAGYPLVALVPLQWATTWGPGFPRACLPGGRPAVGPATGGARRHCTTAAHG